MHRPRRQLPDNVKAVLIGIALYLFTLVLLVLSKDLASSKFIYVDF